MSTRKSATNRAKDRAKVLSRQARMAQDERNHAIRVVQGTMEAMRQVLASSIELIKLHDSTTRMDKGKERTICKVCKTAFPCHTRITLLTSTSHAEAIFQQTLGPIASQGETPLEATG